jgi:uncharacterized membrane protein YgdD (TMEM256/DUF423 family)
MMKWVRSTIVTTDENETLMARRFGVAGAVFGLLGVTLGAFGAHVLQDRLSPADLATFDTGVRYQMYHTLALLFVALMTAKRETRALCLAGWGFLVGIVVFSGSLYGLTLFGLRWLGAVTPLGGLAFLVGWGALAWSILKAGDARTG